MTNFQTLVKNSKLSLKEISEATGIGYSTIGNYNQGSRTPNAKNAQILADYFGVSIPYLLGLDDNPNLVDPGAPKEILNKKEELNQLMETIVKTKALDGYLQFLCYKDYSSESVSRLTQLIYDCLDKERSNFNYENA
ncbi:helix-turn-helix domain-containing protein [Streptococcus constellatus]|uniref:helix-turn-helix domain-containing protein n=1 Tax=Streptococcus constellatus TaxID=76860 RepID=UPI00068FFBBE|nr:helix-turn-helix transcriptional regulator [Streptococcus constellatus]MED5860191.1 helix-turn-helix transcriptional regulator [Streptococcus anginosus]MED5873903.1 helix-turn-helix transcriptional regulator [Streptococcus anginosus]